MKKPKSIKETVDQLLPTAPKHEVEAAGARVWNNLRQELKKHDTSLRSLYGDGWSVGPLEDREFRVLSAVEQVAEGLPGDILRVVQEWDPSLDMGQVLLLLEELQRREFVSHPYRVTEEGARALSRARKEEKQLVAEGDTSRNPLPDHLT